MKMEKIVVGTDFSDPSNMAVAQAMHIARHLGSELVLVHAGTIAEHHDAQFGAHSSEVQGWAGKVFSQYRKDLEELRARLVGQGVEVSQAFHEGLPAKALCEATSDLNANLLVVGSHSFSGLSRFLIGNVAERVIKLSEQSVLVARSAGSAGGFRRILVPLDLKESSAPSIEMALALANEESEIELLHCWQFPHGFAQSWKPGDALALQEIRDSTTAQIKDKLDRLTQKNGRSGTRITFEQMETSPRSGILERIESSDYDLIVVGSPAQAGIQKWLVGSVSESIARHAPCSVLVLKN